MYLKIKIKEDVDFKELEKLGFRFGYDLAKEDLYKDEFNGCNYQLPWMHKMEFIEDYDYDDEEWIANGSIGEPPMKPLKDDDGRYRANCHIIIREDRSLFASILNNDYSYELAGSDLDFLLTTIIELTQAGFIEIDRTNEE